jgi:hypothetical protein
VSINQQSVTLIGPEERADHVVKLGLTKCVMDKVG